MRSNVYSTQLQDVAIDPNIQVGQTKEKWKALLCVSCLPAEFWTAYI